MIGVTHKRIQKVVALINVYKVLRNTCLRNSWVPQTIFQVSWWSSKNRNSCKTTRGPADGPNLRGVVIYLFSLFQERKVEKLRELQGGISKQVDRDDGLLLQAITLVEQYNAFIAKRILQHSFEHVITEQVSISETRPLFISISFQLLWRILNLGSNVQ